MSSFIIKDDRGEWGWNTVLDVCFRDGARHLAAHVLMTVATQNDAEVQRPSNNESLDEMSRYCYIVSLFVFLAWLILMQNNAK